ncbi:MAG: 3,4-dihydroxy 2-butanone 4-phosphate synthase / cyclohydrolase, partial [Solirubrobacteraceae bacterium]|nr:3,4-dihydroxy 2-butanone 4-phosphate synthase / cyclohydrolase [Solirubrobacteraceae bacterium]
DHARGIKARKASEIHGGLGLARTLEHPIGPGLQREHVPWRHQRLVERVVETDMPTKFGSFDAIGYRSVTDSKHHVALVKGDVRGGEDVLVRMHSECLTGDVFGSLRCDCGLQLEDALGRIEEEGRGVLLYLAQEGRGIGLLNKLRAYKLQEHGLDTVDANLELGFPADVRDYRIGAEILGDLGLSSVRLLTNNPKKVAGLERSGLRVTGQVSVEQPPGDHNRDYLRTKASRLGHTLQRQDVDRGDDGPAHLELVVGA